MSSNTSPANHTLPRPVAEIVQAARVFTDTTEQVRADQFGEAAATLSPAERAWVIDRLDDVRSNLADLLHDLPTSATTRNEDDSAIQEAVSDLRSAGDGLREAMKEIDPEADRFWLLHLYGQQQQDDLAG